MSTQIWRVLFSLACVTCGLSLSEGVAMPLVGLGTAGIKEVSTIVEALRMGYRAVDTALLYGNHGMVKKALLESDIPREEIFLTTKVGFFPASMELPKHLHAAFGNDSLAVPHPLKEEPGVNVKGREMEALKLSLAELGVQYIDLCLIHSPVTSVLELYAAFSDHWYGLFDELAPWSEPIVKGSLKALAQQEVLSRAEAARQHRQSSWQQLEEAKRQGICRHIGVSNYPVELMEEVEAYRREPIFSQQQELHPLAQFPHVQSYAKTHGISLTGYGTGIIVERPEAKKVAARLGRSAGQVLLRWSVQKGIAVIPKTNRKERLVENLEVLNFSLSTADMAELDAMDEQKTYYWDTSVCVPVQTRSEL